MRICIDVSPAVHGRAGIGRYAQELASSLTGLEPDNELVIFYNRSAGGTPAPPLDRLRRITVPWGDKPWRLRVLVAYLARLSQDRLLPDVDLFHATDHLLPRLAKIPSVFTLHDLTFLLTDTHTTLNRTFLKLAMPRFLNGAGVVLADSESTRRDALRHYRLSETKIRVVYPGVDPSFCRADAAEVAAVREKYRLPEKFVLSVGTIEPRKNFGALLAAHADLRRRGSGVGLVVAGKPGWRSEGFFQQLRASGLAGDVILPGFVPDRDLPALYSAASVFAFPSLYEGFGLPALEALACGTPVVASNTSSLPEVVGDAGLLVDPGDVGALATAIERVLEDAALQARLRAAGPSQAGRFDWRKTGQQTLEVYRDVLRNRGALEKVGQG